MRSHPKNGFVDVGSQGRNLKTVHFANTQEQVNSHVVRGSDVGVQSSQVASARKPIDWFCGGDTGSDARGEVFVFGQADAGAE